MVQAKSHYLTFTDYLVHNDGTDTRYELVQGQLVAMPPPTWQNLLIARFLERLFEAQIQRLGLDWIVFKEPGSEWMLIPPACQM